MNKRRRHVQKKRLRAQRRATLAAREERSQSVIRARRETIRRIIYALPTCRICDGVAAVVRGDIRLCASHALHAEYADLRARDVPENVAAAWAQFRVAGYR